MHYKIVRARNRYYVLTRGLVRKGNSLFKKIEKKWIRVDSHGKAFNENPSNLKHEGFENLSDAYQQINEWQLS